MAVSTTSSDNKENAPKHLKHLQKVQKKNHKIGYMYLTAVRNKKVNDFTLPRWNTYRNCVEQWLCCHGEGQKVAETFKHCIDVGYENVPEDSRLATGISLRKGACILPRNGPNGWLDFKMHRGGESVSSDNVSVSSSTIDTLRKKLRSKTGLPIVSPALCSLPCA